MGDARDERIAALEAENASLRSLVGELLQRIEKLEAKLNENSSNSGKPPSADSPADREQRPTKGPSGRPRGGQRGHKGSRRELLPPEKVTRVEDCFPAHCRRCERELPRRREREPLQHQVVEVPEYQPDVAEYRLHRVVCQCGEVTCASLPAGVPASMCGPRLTSLIALMTGVYHLSRRDAVEFLGDATGVKISLGALSESEERVSDALAVVVEEAHDHAIAQPVKNVDATSWRQGTAPRTLWTVATSLVTTFTATINASRDALRDVLRSVKGILISDRAPQFDFWAMEQRQVCWAHLIRKFASFAERRGRAGELGGQLLQFSRHLLHQWHELRAGPRNSDRLRREITMVQGAIEQLLESGARMRMHGVTGSCKDILDHRAALWTFLTVEGVQPTNNHAERELRNFVLWRKRCFGSQSERGTRFAERVMTVVHTLRKQGRHVLSYLTTACSDAIRGKQTLSLLPAR